MSLVQVPSSTPSVNDGRHATVRSRLHPHRVRTRPGAHRGQGSGADTPASHRVLPLVRYWGGGEARGNPQLPSLYPPPPSSHRTREPVTLVIANGGARSISLVAQTGYGRGVGDRGVSAAR